MNEIVTKCPAKINLNLRILDKREDGYHNIQTDYQLIDIYDHLKFKSNKDRNITIESKETYLNDEFNTCLLYTSPSPRDVEESRMPSSA